MQAGRNRLSRLGFTESDHVVARLRVPALLLASVLAGCQTPAGKPPVGNESFSGLGGTSWRLVEIQSMDDSQGTTRPDDPSKYTISFGSDGSAALRLDCNRGMGPWKSEPADSSSGSLRIGPFAVTKALCPPPSLGERVEGQLGYVRSYLLRDGRLSMSLMADGGILIWERARDAK